MQVLFLICMMLDMYNHYLAVISYLTLKVPIMTAADDIHKYFS